jgi:hypothetical protein
VRGRLAGPGRRVVCERDLDRATCAGVELMGLTRHAVNQLGLRPDLKEAKLREGAREPRGVSLCFEVEP